MAFDNGYVRLEGFIGNQEISRPNRSMETLFVNGRYIRSIGLFSAIQKAYDTRMMAGRYPFALINISIARAEVDVNVHPAKTEIRFVDQPRVEYAVTSACAQALRQPVIPHVRLPEQPKPQAPAITETAAETPGPKEGSAPFSPHVYYADVAKSEKPATNYTEAYKRQGSVAAFTAAAVNGTPTLAFEGEPPQGVKWSLFKKDAGTYNFGAVIGTMILLK